MRNLRTILPLALSLIFVGNILCQTSTSGRIEVYEKTHIPKKEPVPYKFTREADVYWSKTVWRFIDLKEKMNLPLYFPTSPLARPNLVKLITESIKTEGVKVYDPLAPVEFTVETTKDAVDKNMGAKVDSIMVDGVLKADVQEAQYPEITGLKVKELWFFNKQYSTMEVRIIGLCPVRIYDKKDPKTGEKDSSGVKTITPLFWVYYPDIRRILSQNSVFNTKNDAQNITYDDLFTQRRFSSYIYRESNVYNDREITDYSNGLDVLYESERIKESIFTWEHDLWEY